MTFLVATGVLGCTDADPRPYRPLVEIAGDTSLVHALILQDGRILTWAE